MNYIPNPIDTSKVELSHPISELLELIARNTHEVWALQRISDGWVYGAHRDDDRKEHPCLVAYDALSDAEKNYDRVVAEQVLKIILALGFTIENGK